MQHITTSDAPALALDDILHAMSPSPPPPPLSQDPSSSTSVLPEHPYSFDANSLHNPPIAHYSARTPRASSPEPLEYSELEAMRARVQEYALSSNTREAELAVMVLRLASHLLLHPSPAQLESQAEAIAGLTFQRDLLLRERAEEHDRWQSERELWDRTADALSKKAHSVLEPTAKDPETQRYIARLEDDLKTTRRRLADTQSRFSALERELSRLRPLLSLHATFLRDPQLWRSDHIPVVTDERSGRPAQEPGVLEPDATVGTRTEPQENDRAQYSHSHHIQRASISKPDKQQTRKDRDKDRDKPRKHQHRHSIARPLLADARAECIVVAARKIGRLRAGIVSGFVKERAKLEREAALQDPTARAGAADPFRSPLSPPASQQRPVILSNSGAHATPAAEAGSSSPPVPLAASRQTQGSGTKLTHRRLAPSPYPGTGASLARQPHLPTHLHPSAQAYPIATAGGHAHTIPHSGFVYFTPGPGQSGSVPFVMPVQWPVPSTPPGSQAGQARHPAASTATTSSNVKTPARAQPTAASESSATPMDSLVSAARTLIEDEDYDGDSPDVEGDGELPAVPTETEATAEDATVDETPIKRRGTRRRAAAPLPGSPAPKRRRTTQATIAPTASSTAGPSTPRKTKTAAAPSEVQPKSKTRARAKGKGKAKAAAPSPDHPAPTTASTPAPSTPLSRAPPVARIRSALDVLADQAAQEQERLPSLDAASRRDSESEDREDAGAREQAGESPAVDRQSAAPDAAHDDTRIPADGDATAPGEAAHRRPSLPPASPPSPIPAPLPPPSPRPETPVSPEQGPPDPRSPRATPPAAAAELNLQVAAPADLPVPNSDIRPPVVDNQEAPGTAPPALEIESGDEDAEGSVVDDME